jgi:hypothetical protein
MRLDYLRLRGDSDEDLGNAYRKLLDTYDRGGLPFERVLTRLSYGRWLLARGDEDQARALAVSGLELCRRFGMTLLEVDCGLLQAGSITGRP